MTGLQTTKGTMEHKIDPRLAVQLLTMQKQQLDRFRTLVLPHIKLTLLIAQHAGLTTQNPHNPPGRKDDK